MKSLLIPLLLAATASFAQIAGQATPVDKIKVAKGFKVELLYSVPKETEGSWVAMTQDDKGRMICSDQYGALYRITPPAIGGSPGETKVEKLSIDFGHCQGLLYHAGALYGVVNDEVYQGRGLYRCKDTNGDDQFDTVELLRSFPGKSGEHGPHGVIASPDGKSLYVQCGNQLEEPSAESSRVPRNWAEDQLFPMLLGRGFMRDKLAPGGWLAKTDLDGKKWELITIGTRNTYDIAINRNGDIFGFDADMEWDTGMPWYRPTRVCFMQSGGDFGWRTCSKKFPVRWEDSLPAVVDIGPGSPTGVAFGYGAKFPAKFQDALYICDWSYGKMYAVHLDPSGAGYTGVAEEFMSASPLPLTDIEVSKKDGAMYVSVGGRKVQSGVYRVTYVGNEKATAIVSKFVEVGRGTKELDFKWLLGVNKNDASELRRAIEATYGMQHPKVVDAVWPGLGSTDRNVRFAARIALEHQPIASWKDKALNESNTRAALTALMGLIRSSGGDKALQQPVLSALNKIDSKALKGLDRVTLIRDYMLAFTRMGEPDAATKETLIKHLAPLFPTNDPALNRDLCEVLVYLGDSSIVAKAAPLVNGSPTQEEQIDYARILRFAKTGWTKELRADYFRWFLRAANYKGGASFDLFIGEIKKDALSTMTEEEKLAIKDVLDAKPEAKAPSFTVKPMQFVKPWTLADLEKSLGVGLEGNRNFQNGRNMFGAATCFACHRFNNEGGAIGPDLTSVAGKYS
ncbi:MAG TPA: heme-binding protein, partial [Prosthecobacter sp.]|nr:heme-binding protein [Prosthecobacter sp.]